MSGITIEQAIGYEPEETVFEEDYAEMGAVAEEPKRGFRLKEILMKRTGGGTVEGYKAHVLNFNQSNYMARIIRGLTGIIGDLNFAVVDIAIGIIEMMNIRRGVDVNH